MIDFIVDMIAKKKTIIFKDSKKISNFLLKISQWSKPKKENTNEYFGNEFSIGSANALSIYVATGRSLNPSQTPKYLDFSDSVLSGADLRNGCFIDCCFKRADLEGVLLSHSIFSYCNFEGANMKNVNFGQFPPTSVQIPKVFLQRSTTFGQAQGQ